MTNRRRAAPCLLHPSNGRTACGAYDPLRKSPVPTPALKLRNCSARSTSSISRNGLTGRQVWRALGIGDEGLCSLRMVVRVPRRAFALLSMPNFQT
jgi:hypothetical protein